MNSVKKSPLLPPIVELEALRAENAKLRRELKKYTAKKARKAMAKRKQEQALRPYQAELIRLQDHLRQTKRAMIILFEGRDAAGKSGVIRRISRYMNEQRCRVLALGKPSKNQRMQCFFQRYREHFPSDGEIVMFDRSWYNRAMVEPVFGFCTPAEYQQFMHDVIGFEKNALQAGIIIVKLYFSVTKQEQAKRFKHRKADPLRSWKLSAMDLQAQQHWDDFTHQKYTMLKRTHRAESPWTIIRADDKHAARLNTLRVILRSVPYSCGDKQLNYTPDPQIVISGAREVELMAATGKNKGEFAD